MLICHSEALSIPIVLYGGDHLEAIVLAYALSSRGNPAPFCLHSLEFLHNCPGIVSVLSWLLLLLLVLLPLVCFSLSEVFLWRFRPREGEFDR